MARGDQSPEIKLPSQELIRHAQGDPEVVAEALVKALIEQGKAYEQMGLSVRRLSIEEHQKKLTGVTSHSPYIGQFAYDDSVPRGTTTHLTIWVTNPDSFKQWWVVGYLFFGPGNILADVGQVLLAVDARFPRFGQIGDLDAGTTST